MGRKTVFVDEITAKWILEALPNVAREIGAALQVATAPRPSAVSWGALEDRAHREGVLGMIVRARSAGATEAEALAQLEAAVAERAAARDLVALAVKRGVVA